ncbi:MAG: hypothetical protein HY696_01600 [Deltaproteobacteria bacterium]|nr:hypothetical protein [Deltaproteobacteria bacterium]
MWPKHVPSIDLTYLANRPANTLSTIEAAALKIARRDDDRFLEWTDFSDDAVCKPSPTVLSPADCEQRKVETLWSYRRKLIKQVVEIVGAPLQRQWPTLEPANVAQLIECYAPHARDLFSLVSQLVRAVIEQPNRDNQNPRAVLLFCLTWLITYNLGEAHRWWLDSGHPAIPDVPMADFVDMSLRRLADNTVSIGQIPATEDSLGAAYDFRSNALLFHSEWVDNPLQTPDPNKGEVNIYGAIPHELFHTEWDARGKPTLRARHEIDALIFEYKASIIVRGVQESLAFATTAFAARLQVTRKILAAADGITNFFADLGLLYADTLLFQQINARTQAIAIRELQSGRIHDAERAPLALEYAKAHTMLSTVIFSYIRRHRSDTMKARLRFDHATFQQWAAAEYQRHADSINPRDLYPSQRDMKDLEKKQLQSKNPTATSGRNFVRCWPRITDKVKLRPKHFTTLNFSPSSPISGS